MQVTGAGLERVLSNCINGLEVSEMTQSRTVAVVDGRRGQREGGTLDRKGQGMNWEGNCNCEQALPLLCKAELKVI